MKRGGGRSPGLPSGRAGDPRSRRSPPPPPPGIPGGTSSPAGPGVSPVPRVCGPHPVPAQIGGYPVALPAPPAPSRGFPLLPVGRRGGLRDHPPASRHPGCSVGSWMRDGHPITAHDTEPLSLGVSPMSPLPALVSSQVLRTWGGGSWPPPCRLRFPPQHPRSLQGLGCPSRGSRLPRARQEHLPAARCQRIPRRCLMAARTGGTARGGGERGSPGGRGSRGRGLSAGPPAGGLLAPG